MKGAPAPSAGDSASTGDPLHLLLVDDDRLSAGLIRANVERPGRVRATVVTSGNEALRTVAGGGVDAVLTDVEMPEMDGVQLIERLRTTHPTLPVIALSGQASLERAVEAMRAGATDFLQKPVNTTALMVLVERAVRERPLREEIRALSRRKADVNPRWLIGSDPALEGIRGFARQVAEAPYARVLITGESGTGKTLLARAIHDLTHSPGLFTHLNCAALPGPLLEAELFGYEKGAFTDAREMKRGLVEVADRGTLFLDEIDTLPIELQAKLLVYLETHEIRRVGGVASIRVRTRVVTATSADLREQVRAGRFRGDLLYRLDVAAVRMPSLREMPGVIPELVATFLQELCDELGKAVPEVSAASFSLLRGHPWPGNARELRNAIERALIFHGTGPLEIRPPAAEGDPLPAGSDVRLPLGITLEEVERRYLAATLESTGGAQAGIAAGLGISRKTLWDKRRRYGL
jgi:DNA-binding NtrC family response regulator